MIKALDSYFRLLRFKDWRGYLLMALLGFLISKGFLYHPTAIISFFVMVLLFLAFGFSVNDRFDIKEDRYRRDRVNPVANKRMGLKSSLTLSILLGILGLGLSTIFGLKIFLFCILGLLIGFFYSAPPLRMKSRPFLDIISHGLFAGAFLFVLPILIFSQLTILHYLITFSIFYYSIMLELRNHLEDYKIDKRAKLKTTVCVLGYRNSQNLLTSMAVLYPLTLFLIFLLMSPRYFFLFLTTTFIFFILALFNRNSKMVKNYRIMDVYAIFSFGLLSTILIF